MNQKKMVNCIKIFLCVLGAALADMLVHALMPSPGAPVNVEDFNSVFVEWFGFPVVATFYFVILYAQIFFVIYYHGKKSDLSYKQIGLRYGFAFSLLYIVGMQEIVVEASPFDKWGSDFILYQLSMGLGDGVPAFILCIITARIVLKNTNKEYIKREQVKQSELKKNIIMILIIAVVIFAERVIGYLLGYVKSDFHITPIPVLVWTLLYGLLLGLIIVLLRPVYLKQGDRLKATIQMVLIAIGINWIWFNSFIILVMADTFSQMLLRSGLDTVILFFTVYILERIRDKIYRI